LYEALDKYAAIRAIKSIEGKLEKMQRQIDFKIVAAVQLFLDKMINGDIASDEKEFDGLDKMLVGTENEINTDSYLDLSDITNLKANADQFYEMLTNLINRTNADAIMCNQDMITKIQTVARVLGYKTESEEAFGRTVTSINGVRMIDLKNKYKVTGEGDEAVATKEAIIGKKSRKFGEGEAEVNVTGLTDIYAVHFDVDEGFTGCSVQGDKVINKYLPDFSAPGAVKTGEVEMVAAVCLKNTQNAGVLRNIKIA
ncbi:MAG: phage capsid protein, partial [bacterium]|nr:phage capsid protein [bacterium]